MAKKKAKASQAAGAATDAAAAKSASGTAGKQGSDKDSAKNQKAAGKGSQNAAQGKKAETKGAHDKKGQPQQAAGIGGKAAQLKDFFEESKVELKKVTWPSRKETISTCIAVIVLTIVMSLYLGVVDLGLSKLVSIILS